MRNRLIIMARFPEPGRAKTRLIPLLGPVGAALVHQELVQLTLNVSRTFVYFFNDSIACDVEVRFTGRTTPRLMEDLFGGGVRYVEQGPGDLGQRLHEASQSAFEQGVSRVVLIGTDCPDLTPTLLKSAFDILHTNDVAIGPALDGGYYLIGLKRGLFELFTDIPWGGDEVLSKTLQVCTRLNLSVHQLTPLSDIDTPDDYQAWRG